MDTNNRLMNKIEIENKEILFLLDALLIIYILIRNPRTVFLQATCRRIVTY